MSDSPSAFLARQLQATYAKHTQHAEFGASDHLYELQRLAARVREAETGERKAVASALSAAFGTLADQADGAAVTADAARETFACLDQPIKDCLTLLVANVPGMTAAGAMAKLADAMAQVKLA
jgi:hypothetical protein